MTPLVELIEVDVRRVETRRHGEQESKPHIAVGLTTDRDPGTGVLCEALSLSLQGPRAVVVGDAEPVLGPLFRRARVEKGSFLLLGEPLDQIDPARVGLAPIEPPLPASMAPLDYVAWGARLAGFAEKEAMTRASRCCALVNLGAWASRPLGSLHAVYRRLTVVAQALVTEPAVLVVEAPLAGLDPQAAAYVLQALAQAAEGRAVLTSSPPPAPGSPDEALVNGASGSVRLPQSPQGPEETTREHEPGAS